MSSIMTMNIRYPAPEDGPHHLIYRLPYIINLVRDAAPDFLCFQEMLPVTKDHLSQSLPEYGFLGVGREKNLSGESCTIAYKKSSYLCLAEETFWLSPTPYVPGSRYADQSICPRVCTWGKFYHHASGKMLYVMNTHLDHEGDDARKKGLSLVLSKAAQLIATYSLPLFITGDFNFQPADPAYQLITASCVQDITADIPGSFHAYGRLQNNKIDYILTNQPKDAFDLEVLHQARGGIYYSDHDFIHAVWKDD
ncbi:MAG: endonuclease/exonuclease/phosphatase family protein [Clostridiales bacterium]|nr:endonuclease/exonuclease/phosphatase family protein [Clostridiales bacterium]